MQPAATGPPIRPRHSVGIPSMSPLSIPPSCPWHKALGDA